MAWYYGTFHCSHEGRVNIVGPVKDREWKARRAFNNSCEDCREKLYKEERERKLKEAMQAAEEMELPKLEGTEKQVAWAITLRQELIDKFDSALKAEKAEEELEDLKKYKIKKIKNLDDVNTVKNYIIENKVKATYYINNRLDNLSDYMAREEEEALKSEGEKLKEELERRNFLEVKLESTLFPEDRITDTAVEIELTEDKVTARFYKDDNFRKIVKDLGYQWNGIWEKEIMETTGAAEERAAELGNKLLNKGFPVMIFDKEVRDNAKNGNFEQECTRWIYKRSDEDLLAINWKGRDDTLYKRARSLPGSKWSSPSVVVNVSNFREVEEFADLYGFKFTKAASLAIDEYKEALENADKIIPKKIERKEIKDGLEAILESCDEIIADLKD